MSEKNTVLGSQLETTGFPDSITTQIHVTPEAIGVHGLRQAVDAASEAVSPFPGRLQSLLKARTDEPSAAYGFNSVS